MRHPVAVPSVDPISTAPDYRTDVVRAQRLGVLVREGYVENLIEASIRLAVGSDAVSTVLVGYSSLEHLEAAAAAVNRGPLPPAALERLAALWSGLALSRD
jgi:aryl-alcohol dehydrogenase-like predicted oxidoreductase